MAIYDVTDLEVYRRSLEALKFVYKLAYQLPPSHFKLKTQIIESAESIPALIAEGFAKKESAKEFRRFLRMALGSSDETITHARKIYLLSKIIKRIDKDLCISVGKEYKIISKKLNKLITNWIDYRRK